MTRIGIYPGTFDPLHQGHISFALKAIEACQLDQVVFLPETSPRSKVNVTDVKTRLSLLEEQLNSYSGLSCLLVTSSPFTVQKTLPELQKAFPDRNLTLLVGSDVFAHINEWPDISQLLRSVNLAVGLRHGDTTAQNFADDSITFIELPETAHLSSTTHREKNFSNNKAS